MFEPVLAERPTGELRRSRVHERPLACPIGQNRLEREKQQVHFNSKIQVDLVKIYAKIISSDD